jgi:sec-independent protein translocase protein TatC
MTVADPHAHKMHLMEHLRELRTRIIFCAAIICVGATVSYSYASQIFNVLCAPFFVAFPNSPLIGTAPSEAWFLKLKVSIFAGGVLTAPALFHQLWRFISPGLYPKERKFALPFVTLATLLFGAGASFCYYMVLPIAFAFFHHEFITIGVTPNIKIGEQVSMTLTALAGFGAIFELPLITFVLARLGLLNHLTLLTWFKHAVLGIFIIAAVLTPPDVLSQFLMAGPLLVLYVISIGVAFLATRSANKVPHPIIDTK